MEYSFQESHVSCNWFEVLTIKTVEPTENIDSPQWGVVHPHTLHGTGRYAYIDPPKVGIQYHIIRPYMECLGIHVLERRETRKVGQREEKRTREAGTKVQCSTW